MRKLTELFAVFSIGLAATLLPGSAFAQQDEDVVRTAPTRVFDIERSRPAAIEGLELIRDLYEDFGGDPSLRRIDIRETRALQLGTPLRHFIVPLDRLQKHDQNGKPIALLKPLNKITYPVTTRSGLVGRVVVSLSEDGWEVSSVGDFKIMSNIATAQDQNREMANSDASNQGLVIVPALNLRYIASGSSGNIILTPVNRATSAPGKTRNAEELFLELAERARRMENVPH